MKVDPNQAVNLHHEVVLCEGEGVTVPGGEHTAHDALSDPDSPFGRFCRTLDPNRCYLVALVPDDADRVAYFRAREAARAAGIHMQAPVETPETLRSIWEAYLQSRRAAATAAPDAGQAGVDAAPEDDPR